MKRFVQYKSDSDAISQQALENAQYYSQMGNEYEAKKNLAIHRLFENRHISYFSYTEPFDHLTRYTLSSILVLCVCLLSSLFKTTFFPFLIGGSLSGLCFLFAEQTQFRPSTG